MARLTTLWQSIKIEYICLALLEDDLLKIGGKVLDSNFLDKGNRSLIPVHAEETKDVLSIGDVIKVTLYTPKKEKQLIDNGEIKTLIFKNCGSKYEIWNDKVGGWDKIFEIFHNNA